MSAQCDAILADLDRHAACFDLTRDELGVHLAEAFAVGVFEMMDVETGPDAGWPELSERYAAWKDSHFAGQPMAHLYGVMKDPEQLKGELEIDPDRMAQTYGTTDQARDEAVWFQEGRPPYQPPRPFYDWNGLSERTVAEVLDARFDATTS